MTVIVPVGPQHPALKEPENFRFEIRGEEVVDVDIRMGYVHRGIERAMQDRTYLHNVYLSERICGICNVVHTNTYCQAVEAIAGIEIPDRARYIRTILLELERIHSHLLWAGVAAHEIGFDTLFMYFWRDREHVLDIREAVSGGRQLSATNTVGGVRRDIKLEHIPRMLDVLKRLERETRRYLEICSSDPTILSRCEGVGVLTKQDALEVCAVGPTARAAGVDWDVRRDDPYAAYDDLDFRVVIERTGDVLAQILVRLGEVIQSIEIVRQAADRLPSGPIRVDPPTRIEPNEAVARSEAPRGELLYYVVSNGTDKPERVRVRTPTYGNILTWKRMFKGCTVAEIPIVLASIDPCMACTDRVTLVDVERGRSRVVSLEELRRWKKW